MKFVLYLLLLLPTICLAQNDSARSKTNLGKINVQVGTIIKKEYKDLSAWMNRGFNFNPGNGNITFKSLTITDAASGVQTKGVYVSTTHENTYTAYIDKDELDGIAHKRNSSRIAECLKSLKLNVFFFRD